MTGDVLRKKLNKGSCVVLRHDLLALSMILGAEPDEFLGTRGMRIGRRTKAHVPPCVADEVFL